MRPPPSFCVSRILENSPSPNVMGVRFQLNIVDAISGSGANAGRYSASRKFPRTEAAPPRPHLHPPAQSAGLVETMVGVNLSHRRTHNLLLISKLLSLRDTASPLTLLVDSLAQPATPLIQEYIRRANVRICELQKPHLLKRKNGI